MDYEKKYLNALEWARQVMNGETGFIRNEVEEVFPELRESKDERIRKSIIKILKGEITYTSNENTEEYVAWLEKQVSPDVVADAYLRGCNDTEKKWLEKQGEQKATYKVEPKFHEGAWVVDSQGLTHQIERVLENVTTHAFGYDIVGGGYFNDNNEGVHLWTIADAKDGDVLCWDESKCIALFKNIDDKESFNSYGFVGHCTGTFESRLSYHDIEGAHPATKEQRDLLFTKMKEAGYQWDAEKKELKKIDEDGVENKKQIMSEMTNLAIAYVKQKSQPAWSEEDERLCQCLIDDQEKALDEVRNNKVGHSEIISDIKEMYKERIKWLKSIEGRVQPQPR